MNTGNLEEILGKHFDVGDGDWDGEKVPEPAPAPTESLLGIDVPDLIFDKSFDPGLLERSRAVAEDYRMMAGRPDPFNYELMKQSVGAWSTLINRPVITFEDACDHAVQLCKLWAEEDRDVQMLSIAKAEATFEKEVAAQTNILDDTTKEYQIEEAKLAWREAVRQRNKIVKEWTEYVEVMRNRYRTLRDN